MEGTAHPVWGKNLWVGSQPPTGPYLQSKGFQTLVLCAREFQPPVGHFPGLRVLRCPLDDDTPTSSELALVRKTSALVAAEVTRERRTIVVCHMGLNRSALVAAFAMVRLGCAPKAAIDIVRMYRGSYAFSNKAFERVVLATRVGA